MKTAHMKVEVERVKAVYRDGSFVPREPCDVPEGTEVEIIVQGVPILTPTITDPEERARRLHQLVERMKQNPIPTEAPRFTRDELHERR